MDWDYDTVASTNQQNLKNLDEDGSASVVMSGDKILIGDGHPQDHHDEISEGHQGTVTLKKGGVTSRGSLTFNGIPSSSELENHIAGFSKKEVLYG